MLKLKCANPGADRVFMESLPAIYHKKGPGVPSERSIIGSIDELSHRVPERRLA